MTGGARRRLPDLLPAAVLAAAGVFMAGISWLKWPEIVVDYGMELYLPWRILAGETLYRDLPHLFGPLAQHLNALLFSLFGTGIRTVVVFNLLLIAVLAGCIQGIFRRAFDRLTATLCGLVFIGMFAFARYSEGGNANFVAPYSYELTYGIALFFLLLPALERHLERRERRWAAAAGLLLGLIALTKIEVFLAAAVATGCGFLLPAARERSAGRIDPRAILAFAGAAAVPPLLFVAFFSTRVSVPEAVALTSTVFTSLWHAPIVTNRFYEYVSGFDRPALNLVQMLEVAGAYAALALGIFCLSLLVGRLRGPGSRRIALGLLLLLAGAAAAALLARPGWRWILVGKPLPLFLIGHLVFLAARFFGWRGGVWDERRDVPAFVVSVFALALLLRMVLNVHFSNYGFALAMPGALVVVALLTHHLPRAARRRGGSGATATALAAALVAICLAVHVRQSKMVYDLATFAVGDGPDRFYTVAPPVSPIGPVFNETLAYIRAEMPPDAGFVAIQCAMLNYLARRRNPGKWLEFTPPDIEARGEDRMLADLEAGRPDYVVLVDGSTEVYGPRYFGVDYGFKIKAWIAENYQPTHLAGSRLYSGQGFGIVIARRKAQAESQPLPAPGPWPGPAAAGPRR